MGLLVEHCTFCYTLIDNGLNSNLRPTGPAILPPVGHTGPPMDEIYA